MRYDGTAPLAAEHVADSRVDVDSVRDRTPFNGTRIALTSEAGSP